MKAEGWGVLLILFDFFCILFILLKIVVFEMFRQYFLTYCVNFCGEYSFLVLPVGIDLGEKDSGPRRDHMLCGATTAENQKDTREDFASVSNYCKWRTLESGRKGKVVNIARIANAVQVTLWLSVTNPQCHY